VRVGASEKAKGVSEGIAVNQSIIDRSSETETDDIMRWEGGRAWMSERLIAWERAAVGKIEGRMEDLRMWAREGSEGIRSGSAFLRDHIEKKTYRDSLALANAEMRLTAGERLWDWPGESLNSTLIWI
jgi:hypothetical protein